jgi:hypothetical protein
VQGVDDLFVTPSFAWHLRLPGRPPPARLGDHRSFRFHLSAVPLSGGWVSTSSQMNRSVF